MKNFAVIKDKKTINTIVAESEETAREALEDGSYDEVVELDETRKLPEGTLIQLDDPDDSFSFGPTLTPEEKEQLEKDGLISHKRESFDRWAMQPLVVVGLNSTEQQQWREYQALLWLWDGEPPEPREPESLSRLTGNVLTDGTDTTIDSKLEPIAPVADDKETALKETDTKV